MKKHISFIIVAFIVNCTYSLSYYRVYERGEPIILTEEIGEVLDAEEREQYDLFPGIEAFQEARFYNIEIYSIENGGYCVEIVTDTKRMLLANKDPYAVWILREYIENNEEIQTEKQQLLEKAHIIGYTESRERIYEKTKSTFEKNWCIVDHDEFMQPISMYEINALKGKTCTFGCMLGGAVLGAISGGCLGLLLSPHSLQQEHELMGDIFLGAVPGGVVTGAIGSNIGNKLDFARTVKTIKEARKPLVVEEFD